jgi:16S rRNA (uracil1498-N3)-methyltransferase
MSRRLRVDELAAGPLRLEGEGFHYLAHVLRMGEGDEVVLFDGAGREAGARICTVAAAHLELDVDPPRARTESEARLVLVLALLKGEKMDLVVQKATELGVDEIRPVATERAVVRLDDGRAQSRMRRWQRIAEEAARQSGRASVPEVVAPAPFAAALGELTTGWRQILDPEAPRAARPPANAGVWSVAVGPEGGFTADEVAQALRAGWSRLGLGADRILRAETAAIAIVAGLRYFSAW